MPIDSKEDYREGFVTTFGGLNFDDLQSTEMEIRGRGNSTWYIHPKKPYQLKFNDKNEALGMPEEKKWIFLAEHSDKTLMRNKIAFEMGYISNLDWTPQSHYAEVFRAKDSVFVTKRALAITLQENDSIFVHSDTLMVTGKPEKRITRAYYNAKIFKSDLSGKADSIHMNQKTGLTQLINLDRNETQDPFYKIQHPILWNFKNQITGDSIHLISNPKTETLDSLKVFNNSFVISKDSLGDGYNQISGKKLFGLFEDNSLSTIDIIKNAESIYYLRNDADELVGIDKSKSGSIKIWVSGNAIDEMRKFNQIGGKTHPENEFKENEKILKGFNWRESERPLSVEDLFKDDPPLVLPVIQGLKAYIPQEEFFDPKLIKRVEDAQPKPSKNSDLIKLKSKNKSARKLPQGFQKKQSKFKKTIQKN